MSSLGEQVSMLSSPSSSTHLRLTTAASLRVCKGFIDTRDYDRVVAANPEPGLLGKKEWDIRLQDLGRQKKHDKD